MKIPFNKPYMTGKELEYIKEAYGNGMLAGDGPFTKDCHRIIQEISETPFALLTHSCTAALEMMAILLNLGPGDEVIMPSYTFVSSANAFVLSGATPVFVDINPENLNIDESKIEYAISEKTRAILIVHYAGMSCDIDKVLKLGKKYNIPVLEDAAQGIGAYYKGKMLGAIGDLGTYSFHETKNIICGEGGALLINNVMFGERAEIIREKGTNRSLFFRGQVDKYSWVDIGSSYLPGELIAAFLKAQLENVKCITERRLEIWDRYYSQLKLLEDKGFVRLPKVPEYNIHNAHMFYMIFPDLEMRTKFISFMKENEINTVFHYVPLHSSRMGIENSKTIGCLENTSRVSDCLVRLPLFYELNNNLQDTVIQKILSFFKEEYAS